MPLGMDVRMQRWILLAAFGLFVAVCDGYLTWSVLADRERSLEHETLRYEATASLLAAHSARALEASDALLKRMSDLAGGWDLTDQDVGRDIHRRIVEHVAAGRPVGSAWILDGDGTLVLETWGYPPSPTPFAYRDYFLHHASGKAGLFVGAAQRGTTSGKPRFTVSRAVRWADGSLKAVVVAGVSSDEIGRVFNDVAVNGPVLSALVHVGGGVLALGEGTDPERVLAARNKTTTDDVLAIVRPVEGYPAEVVICVPIEVMLAPWRRRSIPPLFIGVFATLAFGALVWAGMRSVGCEERHKAAREASNRLLEERVRERTADLDLALEEARLANTAKDRFLATVSHDLRQPLQAMSLLAGVVSSTADDDRTRKLAEHVATSLTYGQRLLNDLVDLSQIEAGVAKLDFSEVDLGRLVAEVVTEAQDAAAARAVRLRTRVRPAIAWSDPVRLRQILQNLVSNAIKHTPEGGRVLIAVRPSSAGVALQIWDTGEGIPSDKIDDVFRQFYQIGNSARNSAHGVGLGLAIVKRTAELLGYTVMVRSALGRGSVFSVTVPGASVRTPAYVV